MVWNICGQSSEVKSIGAAVINDCVKPFPNAQRTNHLSGDRSTAQSELVDWLGRRKLGKREKDTMSASDENNYSLVVGVWEKGMRLNYIDSISGTYIMFITWHLMLYVFSANKYYIYNYVNTNEIMLMVSRQQETL